MIEKSLFLNVLILVQFRFSCFHKKKMQIDWKMKTRNVLEYFFFHPLHFHTRKFCIDRLGSSDKAL